MIVDTVETREIDTRTMSENREEILADFQVKHKANQLSLFALVLMIFHVFLNIFMNIKSRFLSNF